MGQERTKKFRGSMTHGKGKKGGRGAGLRGGRGNAGLHKHKYITTVILEKKFGKNFVFGRRGFKRVNAEVKTSINVGQLEAAFPGQSEINLTEAGYDKLLGSGRINAAVKVVVSESTMRAQEKIQAAGGEILSE
ncbi:MAG: 50S ribosomal protein L15 [Thermoplasmata archaeon HGW-Thermoplasmata-1]|nr:MAG: 50S ribosomal protein L15 [Thermoplasmata archaeon HGW-Thermoplasmata-1]